MYLKHVVSLILYCNVACFYVISISLISNWDHSCSDYILWRLHLCTQCLCSMNHFDITMGNDVAIDAHCNITIGNDVARDIYCNVTMSNHIAMCISQCIMTLLWTGSSHYSFQLWTPFIVYYYAYLWYYCFTSKLFKIVHIIH